MLTKYACFKIFYNDICISPFPGAAIALAVSISSAANGVVILLALLKEGK